MVPQTVSFEMRVRFDHIEREGEREISLAFNTFEKMQDRIYKERKQRKRGDRATSATYRMILTPYGKRQCEMDEMCAKRHEDVGKWFTWF